MIRAVHPASGNFPVRMLLGVAGILALQLGIIALFLKPPSPPHSRMSREFTAQILTDPVKEALLLSELEDPALLSSPSSSEMSRKAWMRPKPLKHSFNDWNEPPKWLTPADVARLRQDQTSSVPNLGPSSIGLSTPIQTPEPLPAPPLRKEESTTFQIGGDLKGREMIRRTSFQTLLSTNLHPPTVLQLTVDGKGFVLSARTTSNPATLSPEDAQIEQQAILTARTGLLFAPKPGARPDSLSFGTLQIRWGSRPPTNSVPAKK